jgi:hypothetical protein
MLTRKQMPSPNYSSRGGATVRLIVLHTAEGARTIEELGNFFANAANDVSSHTGIDDKKGVIGEYVRRDGKAWTAANANPVSVQAELCAFAGWTKADWQKHPNMLDNTSRWIAEEAKHFGLPVTKLTAAQAQGSGRGVCQHNDLGSWGGGHWDCGTGFPINDVLEVARGYLNGEGDDEMGYPDWYWAWSNWYLTTDRDPDTRPSSAPDDIPQWAWDANEHQTKLLKRYGMTDKERAWIDWYIGGKQGPRPDVPQDIPDRWWKDQAWAAAR